MKNQESLSTEDVSETSGRAANSCKDSLEMYMKEISRIPLMNREEEEAAAREAAKGSKTARDRLLSANLRFVIKIAKKYRNMGLPLEDLISEGNLGLMYAVDRFDAGKGVHFVTYAVWWIHHSIRRALSEKPRMIRLPQNKLNSLMRIEGAREKVSGNSNRKAGLREIARLVNMDASQVTELLKISEDPVLLGSPIYEDSDSILFEDTVEDKNRVNPEDNAVNMILRDDIEGILSCLRKREADVIRARYGLGDMIPMSLEELGAYLHISKERVRQLESKAIQDLRSPCRKRRLDAYVA